MKLKTILPVLGVFALLGLAACSGFEFERWVRVGVPVGIQQSEGLPASMTLADSREAFAAWGDDVKRHAAQWRAANERGEEVLGILRTVSQSALSEFGPAVAGIPLGPVGVAGLAAVLGITIPRPGDKSATELRKEKEASYNAGLKKGAEAARAT